MLRKGHSQRLRSPLSGCIHETAVRWRDRQHASGASPATWLNLSLHVSPGSVRAMREQGRWLSHWHAGQSPDRARWWGRKWGMHVVMFSQGVQGKGVMRPCMDHLLRCKMQWFCAWMSLLLHPRLYVRYCCGSFTLFSYSHCYKEVDLPWIWRPL